MPTYTPKSADESEQSMIGRVVARSALTDVAAGGVMRAILRVTAEELADAELRLAAIADSRDFLNPDIADTDFDARAKELPADDVASPERLPAVAASGSCMTLTRENSTGAQTLQAGATLKRSDAPTVLYRTIAAVTFNDGSIAVSGVYVVCLSRGQAGNCPAGLINQTVSVPPWLVSAINTTPLTNGKERETKPEAQARLSNYLSSRSRCQPAALKFLGESFQASDGTRSRFTGVWESPTENGNTLLLVDAGAADTDLQTPGMPTTGTVPVNGQTRLWHQMPATAPIASISVALAGGGTLVLSLASGDFVSHPERGLIYVPAGVLGAGDVWTISGYNVWTGLIAELQLEVEGSLSTPVAKPGWRASGTHVFVRPPTALTTDLLIHVVPKEGVTDLQGLLDAVKSAAIGFCQGLAPQVPLYVSALIAYLIDNTDCADVKLYAAAALVLTPMEDAYPVDDQVVRAGIVTVMPA